MIRVDEEYLQKLEKTRKRAGGYLIIASIIILILCFFLYIAIDYAPDYWCQEWGGKMYSDERCYDINNMNKCIDPDGYLRDASRSISMPNFNFSDLEVS